MTQDEIDESEYQNPANWHGGSLGLYYSKRDSRAFVPKRPGAFGAAINFAHLSGVLFLAGILAFAGMMFVLTRGQHR
jgi:uncharacterized membrane protein